MGKSLKLPALLAGCCLTTTLFFNNCGRFEVTKSQSEASFASASTPEPLLPGACFNSKASFLSPNIVKVTPGLAIELEEQKGLAQKVSSPIFKIVALANHQCFLNGESTWLSKHLTKEDLVSELPSAAYEVMISDSDQLQNLTSEVESDPCVSLIDRNVKYKTSNFGALNDPSYASSQKYLDSIGHKKVFPAIYNSSNGVDRKVRIAIIDTGLDVNHPDLKDQVARNSSGAVIGFNPVDEAGSQMTDSGYHGTHVAGLAAAKSHNGIGISGVLGRYVEILPIKVSSDGMNMSLSAIANGILWAIENKADVINMSLTSTAESLLLKNAIVEATQRGVFVVVAAGNEGLTLSRNSVKGSSVTLYPALYGAEIPGMITVGSIDAQSGDLSYFSNRSSEFVELLAPGSNGDFGMLSTVPTKLLASGYADATAATVNGQTVRYPIQGTSMSSPIVAGAAAATIALARSRGYQAHPDQIEELLKRGSRFNSSLNSNVVGGKTLHLESLLNLIDTDTNLDLFSTKPRGLAKGILSISRQPSSVQVNAGFEAILNVEKSQSSSILVNYTWEHNLMTLSEQNQKTLSLKNVTANEAGSYSVSLSSGTAIQKSQTVQVTVTPACE